MHSWLVLGIARAGAAAAFSADKAGYLLQLGADLHAFSNSNASFSTAARASQGSEAQLQRIASFVALTSKDSLVAGSHLAKSWCTAVGVLSQVQHQHVQHKRLALGQQTAGAESGLRSNTDEVMIEDTRRKRSLRAQRHKAQLDPSRTSPNATALEAEGDALAELCDRQDWEEEGSRSWLSAEEVHYARCPPGRYLDQWDDEAEEQRAKRIRKALCMSKALFRAGSKQRNKREYSGYRTRGYMTFESSIWPKAESCKTLPDERWAAKHIAQYYRYDTPLPAMHKLVNEEHDGVEFHLSWKVGSTAFPNYLKCEYGDNWTQRQINAPVKEGAVVATAVREPIGRWVSAAGEVLERIINQRCPNGPCGAMDSFDPNRTLKVVSHQTTWYNASISSDGAYAKTKLDDLMLGLVHDTGCNYRTYAAEHFNTQVNFVTQNPGRAANLTIVVKLEDVDTGLDRLSRKVRGHGTSAKCKMLPENTKVCKPNQDRVPSAGDMRKFLDENPSLLQRLCLIYAQDFICFDYDVPEVCKGLF